MHAGYMYAGKRSCNVPPENSTSNGGYPLQQPRPQQLASCLEPFPIPQRYVGTIHHYTVSVIDVIDDLGLFLHPQQRIT